MEPFRVVCETCSARLKVRDERAIGEIHACPKCGSMVQIAPPPDWQAVETAPSVVQSDFAVPQPKLDAATPAMEFIDVAGPIAPVAASRLPILAWAIGGAALVVAGGLVGAMWSGGNEQKEGSAPSQIAANIDELPQPPPVRDPYEITGTAPTEESPVPESVAEQGEPVAENQVEQPPAQPPLPELPEPDVVTGEPAPSNESPAALPPPSDPPIESAAPAENELKSAHVLKFDPLDFDPARLSLAGTANSANPPAEGSIADDPPTEIDAPAASADEADDDLPPPPVHDQTLHARLGPMPSDASQPHRAAEQLALEVVSLELAHIPLQRFVSILSDMAEVPITLDPFALDLAGVSPMTALSVSAKDTELETLLRDALARHRLDIADRDASVRVVLRDAERWRAVDYEVKDLAAAPDARAISELVQHFVAPATWQAAGGKGTIAVDGTKLKVEQLQSVHHELLIFLERLRLARGLAPRSRYPKDRLSIVSPYEHIANKLNQRTTFTFLPWTRLNDVVSSWQEMSGLTILVDWSALADAELSPASPVACSAIDRIWQDALDGILEPLGLAWWPVDGDTIQITTTDAIDAIQRLEFYAVPKSMLDQFAGRDAMIESLRNELRQHYSDDQEAINRLQLELDEPSTRLIALGSPQAHRYLSQRLRGDASKPAPRLEGGAK